MEIKAELMEQCWSTPVFTVEFGDVENLNGRLSSIIQQKEIEFLNQKDVSFPSTLFFNTFSLFRTNQLLFEWDFEAIREIKIGIKKYVRKYLEKNYPSHVNNHEIRGWANIHRYGDWHGPHSHYTGGNEIVSGVYWVNIPEDMTQDEVGGGRLILFDPRGPFFPERKKIILNPIAGKLILFPSWLQHEVTPIKSKDLRISIGFDVWKT